jgi:DNA-binding NarL/FixJ family response regulator
MSISVAVIEDDPGVRQYLADLIQGSSLCTLAGTARNRAEAMALIADDKADVYVVDLGLPDVDGVELIAHIKQHCSGAQSLVFSTFGDNKHIGRSIAAGATGYLLKDERGPALIDKIVMLHNGASPVSPSVAKVLVQRVAGTPVGGRTAASRQEAIAKYQIAPREVEALDLLAEGYPIAGIADRMDISVHTVNQHLRNVYRKLGVRSRAMAVHLARQSGLLLDE